MRVRLSAVGEFPPGRGELLCPTREGGLRVFTWKPEEFGDGPLLVVFHGVLRNAEEYRNHAEALAKRLGGAVAAPLFDAERFPTARYQQGGVLRLGEPVAERDWTFSLVAPLLDVLRDALGGNDRRVYLLGHSGGGQFLARMAAFVAPRVDQIVAANPGTYLFLNREHRFPLGFGDLPTQWSDDAALERYLAQPLTLYLGTGDIVRDENLDVSPEADRQGLSRYERGRRAWFRARDLAERRGWQFAWRLVEAADIPHDHERMFNHPQCLVALRES
jgi:pimeloyl-ACP methyl ester carboxylesterase